MTLISDREDVEPPTGDCPLCAEPLIDGFSVCAMYSDGTSDVWVHLDCWNKLKKPLDS